MRYALIGEKLSHSLSKVLHNEYFKIKNEDSTYDMIEIEKNNFDCDFRNVLDEKYIGINVTIPYKFDVIDYLDEIDIFAKKIGAVNTIHTKNGVKKGYNTDFYGLIATYKKFGINIKDKDVVILGTGGASKAVYATVEHLGARSITYVSRDKNKDLPCKVLDYSEKICGDVLINSTPIGMYPKIDNCPIDDISQFSDVVDLIYNPIDTMLIKKAKNLGINAVNGLYMLIAQGVYSQSIWHEREFDKKLDEKIIDKIYEKMRVII